MKFSKKDVETLKEIINKIENTTKQEKMRISTRRVSQIKGKTINKIIQKKKKPVRHHRRQSKKRSSIR